LAVAITVGNAPSPFNSVTKAATVQSLDQFNQALAVAGVNLSASITGPDSLTFTSTNDGAGQVITANVAPPVTPATLDAINISANALGGGAGGAVIPTVPDAVSQTARQTLVTQYNQIIQQLTTTAQDASFNGINLLDGNSLKMIFDETGKSTLTIAGVTFNPNGLGLAPLVPGTDFTDNVLTGKVLNALNNASVTLRSQASAFGANLSIVQIRQDFSKKLINVLQTGSANLTLADSNEEAANSQALSTRQSIATSALSLANQSQQGVLQLLR
jgi:flagellin-like hook-associated protein FlgL